MGDIRNDTDSPVWFDDLRAEGGETLVLDEVVDDVVFVRHQDECDSEPPARVRLDPGQRLVVTSPVATVAICLGETPGGNDAIYWKRVITDGRSDGVVYGRTLKPGELDDGRRIHVRPGETFTLPEGSLTIALDEIERFYDELDSERPNGSFAAVVRVWHTMAAIEPRELFLLAHAAAHRLDAATHLLRSATQTGDYLRNQEDVGGPQLLVAVDEYVHLVQEAIVALARCVALIDRARNLPSHTVLRSQVIQDNAAALKDLRDAYEHIDERAFGRTKGDVDERNLMIFDHTLLARDGLVVYYDHRLALDDLPLVLAACREDIKKLIGGPPVPATPEPTSIGIADRDG